MRTVLVLVVIAMAQQASALPDYLRRFRSTYPQAKKITSCQLCHSTGSARNPYGLDFKAAGYDFKQIEERDSDDDGASNLAEIQAETFPGDRTSLPSRP